MDRMVKSGLGAFFYTTHPFRNWGILKICLVTSAPLPRNVQNLKLLFHLIEAKRTPPKINDLKSRKMTQDSPEKSLCRHILRRKKMFGVCQRFPLIPGLGICANDWAIVSARGKSCFFLLIWHLQRFSF